MKLTQKFPLFLYVAPIRADGGVRLDAMRCDAMQCDAVWCGVLCAHSWRCSVPEGGALRRGIATLDARRCAREVSAERMFGVGWDACVVDWCVDIVAGEGMGRIIDCVGGRLIAGGRCAPLMDGWWLNLGADVDGVSGCGK